MTKMSNTFKYADQLIKNPDDFYEYCCLRYDKDHPEGNPVNIFRAAYIRDVKIAQYRITQRLAKDCIGVVDDH